MRSTVVIVLVFAICCASALANNHDELFRNGYFAGRSGDVVIQQPSEQWLDMSVEFSSGAAAEQTTVSDVDFAAELADSLALPFEKPTANGAVRTHRPMDVFAEAPKANLLIVVEDAAEVEAAKTTRVALSHMPGASSVSAALATLLTGTTPSVHGIVGDAWFTRMGENKQVAYHSESEYPLRATVADIVAMMSQHNDQSAVVLSASSAATLARALGARPSLHQSGAVTSLEWDAQVGAFRATTVAAAAGALRLDYATIIKLIQERFPEHQIQTDDAHTALYADIAIMFRALSYLSEHVQRPSASPAVPHYLAFGVHGLSLVKSQTDDEAKYAAANELVHRAVQAVIAEYRAIFGGDAASDKALYQVLRVATRRHTAAATTSLSTTELAHTVHQVMSFFTNEYRGEAHLVRTLPQLYLTRPDRRREVCEALRQSLSDAQVLIYCPAATVMADAAEYISKPYSRATTNSTTADGSLTFADVAIFHVVLWSSIFMGAALIAVLYAFVTANDDDKDTLLFRMTAIKHVKNA